jgi:GTP-binding protein HflX
LNEAVSAILVTIQYPGMSEAICAEHLEELKGLVRTLDFEIRDASIVKIEGPRPRYLIGSGKSEEIADRAKEMDADCVVFDDN